MGALDRLSAKANEVQKVIFNYDDLKKYFPKDLTPKEMQEAMLRILQRDYDRKRCNRER